MDILHSILSNTIIAFIILISIVVFVHELGHFLAGKAFGIEVEEFSIGFGPKAFSFKKGATEYRINWLPLGGYVRFYGSDIEQIIPPEKKEKSFLYAKVHKRAIVSFAGPFANFILSFIVMTFIYLYGVPYKPTVINVLPNSVAEKSGLQTGDKILSIDQKNIESWSDLSTKISTSPEKMLSLEIEANGIKKNINIKPNKEEVETTLGNKQISGRIGITPIFNSSNIIVFPSSFFAQIGLQTGDKVTKIDDKEIKFQYEVISYLKNNLKADSEYLLAKNIIQNKFLDNNFNLTVIRNNSEKNISVNFNQPTLKVWATNIIKSNRPEINESWQYRFLSADQTISEFSAKGKEDILFPAQSAWQKCGLKEGQTIYSIVGQGKIISLLQVYSWMDSATKGIPPANNKNINVKMSVLEKNGTLSTLNCEIPLRYGYDHLNRATLYLDFPIKFYSQSITFPNEISKANNLYSALEKGFNSVLNQIQMTYSAIKMLFTGSIPLSNLGGPIAIANVAGEAAKGGLIIFLMTMAFISTNIGMMNLLPLPALDGGHLFLNLVEAAYGKSLPKNIQITVQRIGIFILLTLFVIVFYNDILRLIRFH
ncbi:RIP metalloprotease RseP [Pigmentibacter sp. JX0631]|uniref:RIP metalloprotease RseP n=1 Tax=Pigmentibacter sp. JX0631 TaxID=2976982 RepID=UPI0024692DEE|nr:RIP metalloprotease RseP [Pigmentibacter sp. JX0631]WGL60231.1 RIP metalloprotease RseP [Pigmentibacter sp. JX0631]